MKAALNGMPSLSVLDGWWLEGHVEGVTGWAIGSEGRMPLVEAADSAAHVAALYDTLEHTVAPLFYRNRDRFTHMMRYAIALNGSFFTAQRMLQEYVVKAYGADAVREPALMTARPREAVTAWNRRTSDPARRVRAHR